MYHPFESIPVQISWWLFIALAVFALLLMLIFQIIPLNPNIIQFEFNADRVFEAWNETDKSWAAFSLGLDFLFIIVYANAISLACFRVATIQSYSLLARLGILLAWGQLLAAVLDIIENIALINVLFKGVTYFWVKTARICAFFKFGIIIIGVLYSAIGVLLAIAYSWLFKSSS